MSQRLSAESIRRPRIVVAESEHRLLSQIAERAADANSPVGEYLAEEMSRALVVPDQDCADSVVKLGSTVSYREDTTGRVRTVQLVLPRDADVDQQRISVLTPIGAALIGMSAEQSIDWLSPDARPETLTVLRVEH